MSDEVDQAYLDRIREVRERPKHNRYIDAYRRYASAYAAKRIPEIMRGEIVKPLFGGDDKRGAVSPLGGKAR